jgi:hypothetical protein
MASFFGKLFGSSSDSKSPEETEAEVNDLWAGLTEDQRQTIYTACRKDSRLPTQFMYELDNYRDYKDGIKLERFRPEILERDVSRVIDGFYIINGSFPVRYKENPTEKAKIYSIFREKLVDSFKNRIELLRRLNEITNRDGSEGRAKLTFKIVKGISDDLLKARVDLLTAEKSKAGAAWGSVAQPGKTRRRKYRK